MEKQALAYFAKEGFLKRAQDYGVSPYQAEQLFKRANEGIMASLQDFYNNNREAVNTAGAGLAGGAVGAGIGGLAGGSKGALAGGLAGAGLGAGGMHMYQNQAEPSTNIPASIRQIISGDQNQTSPRGTIYDKIPNAVPLGTTAPPQGFNGQSMPEQDWGQNGITNY